MPTGSGEVDLDALLEDLCVMERDMTSSSETDSMFSETISSPIINSPISPKMKVCCEFFHSFGNRYKYCPLFGMLDEYQLWLTNVY